RLRGRSGSKYQPRCSPAPTRDRMGISAAMRMSASLIGRLGSSAFRLSTNSSVDVAHGLSLLFGLGTKALPSWDAAHIEPQPARPPWSRTVDFYATFRKCCSEGSLSGRGLSLKVCGQLVHDTSPT